MLDHASLTLAYAAALALGIASAFGIPAGTAILPQAVPPPSLQTANSLQMGARQLSLLAGPLLAALVLGAHDGAQQTGMAALAAAFAIDALTFLFSAWTLRQVKPAATGRGGGAGHVARHGGGPGHGVARPALAQLLCVLGGGGVLRHGAAASGPARAG